MLIAEPPRTAWDVNFQLLGIPVRVHPLFWLAALLIGSNLARGGADKAAFILLLWVAIMFFSILVHEFGHALVMRYYGMSPHVVLYLMGGLAVPGSTPYAPSRWQGRRGPWEWIIITAAGPGAGFLLAALMVLCVYATGGAITFYSAVAWDIKGVDPNVALAVHLLLFVNIFWGLINLLPVQPLDGGQICRELMVMQDPGNGLIRSLWVSVIVGAVAALAGAVYFESILMLLLFGSLAVSSYLTLQQMSGRGGFGGPYGGNPW